MIKRLHFHLPHIKKWVAGMLLGILGAFLLADIYLETVGLPVTFRQLLTDSLREQGIVADVGRLKIGMVRGVKAYNVILWDERRGRDPMLEAERVRCRLKPFSLLLGRPEIRSFEISGGTMQVPYVREQEPRAVESPFDQKLTISGINGDGLWNSKNDMLEIRTLRASVEGVQASVSGVLKNVPVVGERGKEPLGWQHITALQLQAVQDRLAAIDRFLETNRFSPNDAQVSVSATVDLNALSDSTVSGDFRFNRMAVNGVLVPEVGGSFSATPKSLILRNFRLGMAQDTVVDGMARLSIPEMTLAATLHGSLEPKLIFRILNVPMPRVLAETVFVTPPNVDLSLTGDISDPKSWQSRCQFLVNGLRFRNAYLQTVKGTIIQDPDQVRLEDAAITFEQNAHSAPQTLTFAVSVDRKTSVATLDVHGQAEADSLVQTIPTDIMPIRIRQFIDDFNFGQTDMQLNLVGSGRADNPKTWVGNAKLAVDSFAFRDLPIKQLAVDIDIKNGILKTSTPIHCELRGDNNEFFTITARLDAESLMLQGSLKGALDLLNCYRATGLADNAYLDEIHFQGPPAEFEFKLDSSPLQKPLKWHGSGKLDLHDILYETMTVNQAVADVELAEGHLFLRNVKIDSPAFETLAFEFWDINLKQTEITVKGRAVGDPKDLGIFADRGQSRREYQHIWKDFDWGDSPPTVELKELKYVRYPDEITRWRLTVDSVLTDTDASYSGFHADQLTGAIRFDLPNKASITDIKLKREDGWLDGNIYFDFTTDPIWWFDCKGQLNPAHLFKAAGEADAFESITFGDDTRIEMNGKIHMRGGLNPQVDSHFSGSQMRFDSIRFDAFDLTWNLVDNDLRWELISADLHGGKISGKGLYNWFSGAGTLDAEFNKVDLSQTLGDLGREVPAKLGRLNGEIHAQYRQWSEDTPVNIRGVGTVKIEDGQLWEAPIIKQLGSVIGLGSFGSISQLQADLVFDGATMNVPQFSTNGTIVSLEGNGAYSWSDHSLNFNVKGRALKTTGIISKVFTPLSWLFEAKLQGTLSEPKWVQMSKIRDLLPGGGN
jgi:hypothetical protein